MFQKESNNTPYSAQDIARYHEGLMSMEERNALERAALEDPFLEEAIEGYKTQHMGTGEHDAAGPDSMRYDAAEPDPMDTALENLRRRLAERVSPAKQRVLGIYSWWAAASLVLLMGAGLLWYTQPGKSKKALVADQLKATEPVQTPGGSTQGTSTQGTSTPGTSTPGTLTPGTSTPGTSTPGTSTPGVSTRQVPVSTEPKQAPAPNLPATQPGNAEATRKRAADKTIASNTPMRRLKKVAPASTPPSTSMVSIGDRTEGYVADATSGAELKKLPGVQLDSVENSNSRHQRVTRLAVNGIYFQSSPANGSAASGIPANGLSNNMLSNAPISNALVNGPTGNVAFSNNSPLKGTMDKANATPVQFKLTDANHNPIAYGTVKILPHGYTTTTDTLGYFTLPFQDSSAKVAFTALGYQEKSMFMTDISSLGMVTLTPQTSSLHDVVVSGLGTPKKYSEYAKKAVGPYPSYADSTNVQPIEGWDNYRDYLSANMQIPMAVKTFNIHGEVSLSFQVDEKGHPYDISVEQSLCSSCDAEAIRLVQTGPAWKTSTKPKGAKKKKKRGWVRIHF